MFSKEDNNYNFQEIIIEDTGLGFDDNEFNRLIALNDCGKGFSNKGSGKIQFLHFFEKSEYKSIYRASDSSTGYRQRIFTLSSSKPFLDKNAIINLKEDQEINTDKSFTSLSLKNPLSEKDENLFKSLTVNELKENIISHYLAYFCENRENLPEFKIQIIIDGEIKKDKQIVSDNIPIPLHCCWLRLVPALLLLLLTAPFWLPFRLRLHGWGKGATRPRLHWQTNPAGARCLAAAP